MSPTMSDDLLVRELTERADRAVPSMSLDPVGVLAAGRRNRRQRIALRSSAGLVVAFMAVVGTTQVWRVPVPGPTVEPPAVDQGQPTAAPQTVELAPGVIAVSLPAELTLDDGTTVLDLGIRIPDLTGDTAPATRPLVLAPATVAQIAEANVDPERLTWDAGVQLTHVGESGTTTGVPFLWRTVEASYDYAPEPGQEVRWDTTMRFAGDESGLFFGTVPPWLPGVRVVLYSANGFRQDDGTRTHSLEVPVYPAPTDDGRLLYTVWIPAAADGVDGFATDVDATLAISSDGRVVGGQRCSDMTLDECAGVFGPEIYAAADLVTGATDTLRIETATDVRPVETDDGPAFDLGVQVGDDWDPLDQDLTYALRAGSLVDGDSRTTDQPGLWLVTLARDGSTVTGAGGSVDEALAPDQRNPIWSAGLTDHEAYVVGIRPPTLDGATFDLLIERDSGDQVVPIPTFRVPGLDADVWFVAVTDPEAAHSDWRTITIVVTATDGSTSTWNLAGHELTASP